LQIKGGAETNVVDILKEWKKIIPQRILYYGQPGKRNNGRLKNGLSETKILLGKKQATGPNP
jgi:hypothetical protein